jgi:hypothetical protein
MIYRPRITVKTEEQLNEWKTIIDNQRTGKITGVQRWLVVSDVHRPFHNQVLWGNYYGLYLIWVQRYMVLF